MAEIIGEVIATSTGEVTGQAWKEKEPPAYGSFIALGNAENGRDDAAQPCIGVVYNIETASVDVYRRPSALEKPYHELQKHYPQLSGLIRPQYQALLIGGVRNGAYTGGLPAKPPALHSEIRECGEEIVRSIVGDANLFRLLFASGKSSTEELILNCAYKLLEANGWRRDEAVLIGKSLSDLYRDDYDTLRRLMTRLETWLNR